MESDLFVGYDDHLQCRYFKIMQHSIISIENDFVGDMLRDITDIKLSINNMRPEQFLVVHLKVFCKGDYVLLQIITCSDHCMS